VLLAERSGTLGADIGGGVQREGGKIMQDFEGRIPEGKGKTRER
jgi:hypothetical protein